MTALLAQADLARLLAEAEATIAALLSGQIDAVVDPTTQTPVLLAKAQDALRESEERYRKSEEQYRQIVESTTDGIIKIDDRVEIVFVNRRFAEMLGYEPDEMIGTSGFAFMSLSARIATTEGFYGRAPGSRAAVESTFRHKDGTEIAVSITGSPLYAGGRYVGSLGVVRDVTEEQKLHSQLMVSDRMASVGTLAAGVAHEINNPLAAVIANLDYIADSLGQAPLGAPEAWMRQEIKAPLAEAREAAQRVRLIVRDLKVFSRSPIDDPKGAADVHAIMESSLRMAWNEVRHRAQVIKHYGIVPPVRANEARLGQVFLNLLVNAAQALPEGQAERNTIQIRTSVAGPCVVVEVRDTGPGIPAAILGRIFDAFFTTKAVGMGTGLGLAICQRIITDMDGELTVTSVLGTGTTFRVTLPIAPADDVHVVEPAQVEVPAGGRRGRILVVDDEEMLVRTITRILSKEHEVVGVITAKEALALFAAGERFDLILCDLMMPEMTGMELHSELTRIAPDQASRMLFLTGGAFTITAREFLSDPPREHLEKPFDPGNLRAIVHRYLRTA